MNKKQLTAQTYNDNAVVFQKKFDGSGARSDLIDRTFKLCNKNDPYVLELGCAYGRDASKILKKTKRYIGVDIAPNFIQMAQAKNPTGQFIVADIENYEFPNNLDIIFSFATLLHCDFRAVQNIFNRAYSALNSKGLLHITLRLGAYHEKIKKDEHGTRYFYYYSLEDLEQMTSGKFRIIYKTTKIFRHEWLEIIFEKLG